MFKKFLSISKKYQHQGVEIVFAFHLLEAMIPSLTLLVYFTNLLELPSKVITDVLGFILPENSVDFIQSYIQTTNTNLFNIVVFAISFNLVVNGVIYLIHFLNHVDNNQPCNLFCIYTRGIIFATLLLIISTLSLFFFSLFSFYLKQLLSVLLFPILFVITFFIITLSFKYLPCKIKKLREIVKGSFITSFLISLLFSLTPLYSKYLLRFDNVHGSLSVIIVFLLLFQLIGFCLKLGIFLNASFNDKPC